MSTSLHDLARQHLEAGRHDQAEAMLRRILASAPADLRANNAMALICAGRGQPEKAEFFYQRALSVKPPRPEILQNYGFLLTNNGKHAQAKAIFEQLIAANPAHPAGWTGLCAAEVALNEVSNAVEHGRKALSLGGQHESIYGNLANALMEAGQVEEALKIIGEGVARYPHAPLVRGAYLCMLHYPHDPVRISPRFILGELSRLGGVVASEVQALAPAPKPTEADRPLRIAYFSSDLRAHSVAWFMQRLLRHRDKAAFHVSIYHFGAIDAISERFRAEVDDWVDARFMNDAALAQRIRSDRIDLLIDLNGHSYGNRLGVLARRPAPLQATYLGFPNVTGVPGIDFRVVDALTDPEPVSSAPSPGLSGSVSAGIPADPPHETLVRLARCFLCFEPHPQAPACEPASLPAPDSGASITFGSFNAIFKASDYVLRIWADVLKAVPGSRLIMKTKALAERGVADQLVARLIAQGIEASRVELLGMQPTIPEHLAHYQRVDIALDTFPYHGTTTTCETLHMGVPLVTLAGDSHVSRVGVSILNAVGLGDLVARDREEYVRIAVGLARNTERRKTLRSSLRDRLLASPVCDGASMARALEGAYRAMWREKVASAAGGQ